MSQQYPQGQFPQGQNPQQLPAVQASPKKHTVRNVLLIGLGSFVALVGGCSALLGGTSDSTGTAGDSPGAQVSTPPRQPTPSATAPRSPSPIASSTKPSVKPTTQVPKPKPVVFNKITARQWKLIAKDPDAHVGEQIIVHGRVSQFDAATGTDAFWADVDGVKRRPSYGYVDYPTNTVLVGQESDLADLVEDDLFTAKVTVSGSLSYDTQIGGETVVPKLEVESITVTGSVAD